MNDEYRAKQIFLEAIESGSPDEWPDFVLGRCQGDETLQRQVEMLLEAHAEADSLLDRQGIAITATREPQTPGEAAGELVGPYKLLERIGEGGMGVVWMADQHQPVKRRVALKIIKPGMDSGQVIARFEAERQALAMMDHPNIARVLDAGACDNGRPYFVMELVKGVPITTYCDDNHLSTRQRLELFIPVCQAVQHAHHKGIIHRDIKPSNVLIAQYDDRPVPKIIDFGVAKALNQALTEKTMFTQFGQIVGTLEYMSPEQAKFNQLDVDTRSDVYSLGVLLYELLTGATPFDGKRLRSSGFDEMLRIIGEEEPQKPSTRLSMSDTLPAAAANRRTEAHKLPDVVRGDLDWIVMKTLSKERTERYETASALAADVQRHLDDVPIVARRPSLLGRMRRFVRRNKVPVAVCSFAALCLAFAVVLGAVLSVQQARQARWESEQLIVEFRRKEADKRRAAQDRVHNVEIPRIRALMDAKKPAAAFDAARQALQPLPDDPTLVKLWDELTRSINLESSVDGVRVSIRDWDGDPHRWFHVATTPAENIRVPRDVVRWKLQKEGFVTRERVLSAPDRDTWKPYIADASRLPEAMVFFPAAKETRRHPATVPFLIHQYEVTNADYQQFVDAGGYDDPAYWEHEFVREGKVISREEALAVLVDRSGQSGPAGWSEGRYPPGEENYPVCGVSWYEAAAYAKFAKRSLPTVHHWFTAADMGEARYIIPLSNFSSVGPAPVGKNLGIGSYNAVYDMAGNVKEWCFNEGEPGTRTLRGGAWNEPSYMFVPTDADAPMSRLPTYGFRCVKYLKPPSDRALGPIRKRRRFPSDERPATSEQLEQYLTFYEYDRKTPDPGEVREQKHESSKIRHQIVEIDAAYGERFDVHLYLPKENEPPYEVLVWTPGIDAFRRGDFNAPSALFDYGEALVETGRAVCVPIVQGTYERMGGGRYHGYNVKGRRGLIQIAQDLSRTIDYLETRSDVDSDRLVYCGLSWGAMMGPVYAVVEPRFKAAVLIAGGFARTPFRPEVEPFQFAPHVKIPVLMINGRYDAINEYADRQVTLFDHLGGEELKKDRVILESGHIPPVEETVRAVDDWLREVFANPDE